MLKISATIVLAASLIACSDSETTNKPEGLSIDGLTRFITSENAGNSDISSYPTQVVNAFICQVNDERFSLWFNFDGEGVKYIFSDSSLPVNSETSIQGVDSIFWSVPFAGVIVIGSSSDSVSLQDITTHENSSIAQGQTVYTRFIEGRDDVSENNWSCMSGCNTGKPDGCDYTERS